MRVLNDKMAMTDMMHEAQTCLNMAQCIVDELKNQQSYLPYLRAKIDAAKKAIERVDMIAEKYEKKDAEELD